MSGVRARRRGLERVAAAWAAGLVVLLAGAGCGAAEPEPPPRPAPSSVSASAPVPTRPAPPGDGVTLRQLGFANGPPGFSVPRDALYAATSDQPGGVTLVLSSPAPAAVVDYLRRSLPAAGFAITAEASVGPTLTFTGAGWTGSFTATGDTSAILLRPA